MDIKRIIKEYIKITEFEKNCLCYFDKAGNPKLDGRFHESRSAANKNCHVKYYYYLSRYSITKKPTLVEYLDKKTNTVSYYLDPKFKIFLEEDWNIYSGKRG